jgi:hypothetical protein
MRYPMSSSRQNPRDVHRSPLRPVGLGLGRLLATLVILGGLAGGAPAQPQKGAVANPEAVNQSAVLSATSTGAAARQFQCLSRDAQGNCTRNKCTRGPGGQFYDCGSFAQACKNAGLDWTGSREGDEAGGVCSVKKKAPQ